MTAFSLTKYAAMTETPPHIHQLFSHPSTPCAAVQSLTVEVHAHRQKEQLALPTWCLRYQLQGTVSELYIPSAAKTPCPTDELWKHTCFEAFIGQPGTSAYREFNFAPSGHWAAYAFSDERVRDDASEEAAVPPPNIALTVKPDTLTLEAHLPWFDGAVGELLLGLTAVIETRDGNLSYWALHHPTAKPDFHRKAGWTARLVH